MTRKLWFFADGILALGRDSLNQIPIMNFVSALGQWVVCHRSRISWWLSYRLKQVKCWLCSPPRKCESCLFTFDVLSLFKHKFYRCLLTLYINLTWLVEAANKFDWEKRLRLNFPLNLLLKMFSSEAFRLSLLLSKKTHSASFKRDEKRFAIH